MTAAVGYARSGEVNIAYQVTGEGPFDLVLVPPASDRVLATVLFTDLVGSTERATALGDAAWASLFARHDATIRAELARFGGEGIERHVFATR